MTSQKNLNQLGAECVAADPVLLQYVAVCRSVFLYCRVLQCVAVT